MDIICDLGKYKYRKTLATKREYCLNQFNLTNNIKYKKTIFAKLIYKFKKKWIYHKGYNKEKTYKELVKHGIFSPEGYFEYYPFDKILFSKNITINGLFQAHKYFDEILPILRNDFTLIPPPQEIAKLLDKITSEESICIHWRRGDYLSEQYKDSLLVCNDLYYNSTIAKIKEKIKNLVFYIFTNSANDALWIKHHHTFDISVKYINLIIKECHSDLDDFRLMCSCKHFIISNSTFSWWAQYLSLSKNKIVVAPSIWNKKQDAKELYFKEWEIILV